MMSSYMSYYVMKILCLSWAPFNVFSQYNLDDPNFKNKRPKHREFMKTCSRMISVVPFKNPELLNLSIITNRL